MSELRTHVGPWREVPCPSEAPHAQGAWSIARIACDQHPLAVRVLWRGDQVLALGGVVELARGDGLACVWRSPDLSPMAWRRLLPLLTAGVWHAHERGVRRISAIVAAGHAAAVRFVKRLGFSFAGIETGYAGTTEPMLRYVHCAPEFPDAVLVRYQLLELERECFRTWCPELAS